MVHVRFGGEGLVFLARQDPAPYPTYQPQRAPTQSALRGLLGVSVLQASDEERRSVAGDEDARTEEAAVAWCLSSVPRRVSG